MLAHYKELVRLFPNDERAHTLLGNLYFGRQDYDAAVKEFVKATAINPSFSQPYNQLGYAYRFLDKLDDAEAAFKKYVQLIPDDPNPHDSYAELLMKRGRFAESIKAYEKALSLDPNFVASYVGIGNNYLCEGRTDQARTAFARIAAVARNDGRAAAGALLDGGRVRARRRDGQGARGTARGVRACRGGAGFGLDVWRSRADGRRPPRSGTARRGVGEIRRGGQGHRSVRSAATSERRHAQEPRLRDRPASPWPVATSPPREARPRSMRALIAARKAPFEVRQLHELRGSIALADKRGAEAVKELAQANQQDPRVLYLTALAFRESGDARQAAVFAGKAARFNGLSFNYAYVRTKAATVIGPATE